MRWRGGRGEMSSFRVLLLESSPLVALRVFPRGHCYCYPGFTLALLLPGFTLLGKLRHAAVR